LENLRNAIDSVEDFEKEIREEEIRREKRQRRKRH